MSLWVLRDIRIVLLPATLSDARQRLARERRAERANAVAEFAGAISLIPGDDDPEPRPRLLLPDSALAAAVAGVTTGGDRALVEQAVRAGAHVFLTRDKGVLSGAHALRSFGLVIASPQELLDLLAACGALCCMLEPQRHLHWPFPDLQRVTHLARAIPGLEVPGMRASILTVE